MGTLDGRHALITGGGKGIGLATAGALTAAGATVTVTGRGEDALKEAVAGKLAAGYFVSDVTDPDALAAGIREAAVLRGPVDILVANAGAAETAPFLKTDPGAFHRLFELNVMGTVYAIRAVMGDMIASGFGRIVVVASTAGLKGYPYTSAYCVSKHAVIGLVRSLAHETAKSGVTINAVCPGFTDTDLVRESVERITKKTGRSPADIVAEFVKDAPIGRLIRPDEVAAAITFLCQAEAGAMTGATMTVAGGEI